MHNLVLSCCKITETVGNKFIVVVVVVVDNGYSDKY